MLTETQTVFPASMLDPTEPRPGIYEGVSFEIYRTIRAVNHSTLKHMATSPAHYLHEHDHPERAESDAMRLGTAEHAMMFEPERFAASVVPAPINPKTGNAYGSETKAWAEYAAAHPGKMILSDDELTRLRGMAAAVRSHPMAGAILAAPGTNEVTMVWVCPITGLRCKGRVDARRPDVGGLSVRVDLKTCESAGERAMAKALEQRGYDTAAAFYGIGAEALGIENETHVLVCVESEARICVPGAAEPAHAVAVYRVGEATFGVGMTRVREWLHALKRCIDSNQWPAYSDEIVDLEASTGYLQRWSDGEF